MPPRLGSWTVHKQTCFTHRRHLDGIACDLFPISTLCPIYVCACRSSNWDGMIGDECGKWLEPCPEGLSQRVVVCARIVSSEYVLLARLAEHLAALG